MGSFSIKPKALTGLKCLPGKQPLNGASVLSKTCFTLAAADVRTGSRCVSTNTLEAHISWVLDLVL